MPAEQQQSVLMAKRIWLGVTVSTRAIINEVVESRVLASAVSRFGDAGGFEDLIDLKGLKEPVNFPVIPWICSQQTENVTKWRRMILFCQIGKSTLNQSNTNIANNLSDTRRKLKVQINSAAVAAVAGAVRVHPSCGTPPTSPSPFLCNVQHFCMYKPRRFGSPHCKNKSGWLDAPPKSRQPGENYQCCARARPWDAGCLGLSPNPQPGQRQCTAQRTRLWGRCAERRTRALCSRPAKRVVAHRVHGHRAPRAIWKCAVSWPAWKYLEWILSVFMHFYECLVAFWVAFRYFRHFWRLDRFGDKNGVVLPSFWCCFDHSLWPFEAFFHPSWGNCSVFFYGVLLFFGGVWDFLCKHWQSYAKKKRSKIVLKLFKIVHKYFLFGLLTDLCCPKTYETVQ